MNSKTNPNQDDRDEIAAEVIQERHRQDQKWGEQSHPNGTGSAFFQTCAPAAKRCCDTAFKEGRGTWEHILSEEFYEALAESDPERLRAELIQVAAVAIAWVECIDRKAFSIETGEET